MIEANKKIHCYQCQGRGYVYKQQFIGVIFTSVKEQCHHCQGRGYTVRRG